MTVKPYVSMQLEPTEEFKAAAAQQGEIMSREMHQTLIDASIPVQKAISLNAPVGTESDRGRLKGAVRYHVLGATAEIWPPVWYANVQERGGTLVPMHRGRKFMKWTDANGKVHFAKRVTLKGKFFIRRGAEQAFPAAVRIISKGMQRAVAKAIGVDP